MTTVDEINEISEKVKSRYINIPTYDSQPWELFLRFATPVEIERMHNLKLRYQSEEAMHRASARQRVIDRCAKRRKSNAQGD